MANVIDLATGKPLGGARPTMLLQWGGIKLGLVGKSVGCWLVLQCCAAMPLHCTVGIGYYTAKCSARSGWPRWQRSTRPLCAANPCTRALQHGVYAGLVEQEWLTTLAAVDPSSVRYTDFVQEGRRLAAQLRVRTGWQALAAGFAGLLAYVVANAVYWAFLLGHTSTGGGR